MTSKNLEDYTMEELQEEIYRREESERDIRMPIPQKEKVWYNIDGSEADKDKNLYLIGDHQIEIERLRQNKSAIRVIIRNRETTETLYDRIIKDIAPATMKNFRKIALGCYEEWLREGKR